MSFSLPSILRAILPSSVSTTTTTTAAAASHTLPTIRNYVQITKYNYPTGRVIRFRKSNTDLFRISPPTLRAHSPETRKASEYDVVVKEDGMVHPAAPIPYRDGKPNGARFWAMGKELQDAVRKEVPEDGIIWRLPKGTFVKPAKFMLSRELRAQFSIETTEKISLDEFNERLAAFLQEKAERMTVAEFFERYPPQPLNVASDPNATTTTTPDEA